jgi:anti-sigma regulatory factor (Ser/Thr protein kinase)
MRDTLSAVPGNPDLREDAVLLASELASNVVEHARIDYEIQVSVVNGRARVEVADGSAILPAIRDLSEYAERGRGLSFLATVADAWGVDARTIGKAVWFEIALASPCAE